MVCGRWHVLWLQIDYYVEVVNSILESMSLFTQYEAKQSIKLDYSSAVHCVSGSKTANESLIGWKFHQCILRHGNPLQLRAHIVMPIPNAWPCLVLVSSDNMNFCGTSIQVRAYFSELWIERVYVPSHEGERTIELPKSYRRLAFALPRWP